MGKRSRIERARVSPRALRYGNRLRIIAMLREHGGLHRTELARKAGLPRSAVSTLIAELIAEGLVAGAPKGQKSGGAGEIITLKRTAGVVLGMDYGPDSVRVALVNLVGEVLAVATDGFAPSSGWPGRLDIGLTLVRKVLDGLLPGTLRVIGVGLGMREPIEGVGIGAADDLARRLGLPVALGSIPQLAALAEASWGAGVGARGTIHLIMSDRIDAAFVIDCQVLGGVVGSAGEIGHVSVSEDGPPCPCGNRGCLELYAGLAAILGSATLAELMADDAGRRMIAEAGRLTGRVLTGVCSLLHPELIIVGGELAEAGELLFEPMRAAISRHSLARMGSCPRIVPAALGQLAGVHGAVSLILRDGGLDSAAYLAVPESG